MSGKVGISGGVEKMYRLFATQERSIDEAGYSVYYSCLGNWLYQEIHHEGE
jgi:hypothetical protein